MTKQPTSPGKSYHNLWKSLSVPVKQVFLSISDFREVKELFKASLGQFIRAVNTFFKAGP